VPRNLAAIKQALSLLLLLIGLAHAAAATPDLAVPEVAIGRVTSPRVLIAPDRADWTYQPGEMVTFNVMVIADGQPAGGTTARYRLGPEQFEAAPVEILVPKGSTSINGGTLNEPGFLRCRVTVAIDGKEVSGMATAAFAPEQIMPTQTDPADFDAFWGAQLQGNAELPLGLNKTLLPELCTADVNVYHVSYRTAGNGGSSRFYGMLTEPAREGRYPAVLMVPGAGVRPYGGDVDLAAKGVIVLQLGIHGIAVNLPQHVYNNLSAGALHGYPTLNLDNPNTYYYRRVYLGCVRGNDVLTAHPMWDGKNLVVAGGSQGGQLSIVVSALDPRVTGTVSNFPAYCDVTGYLHGRAGGWPHMMRGPENRSAEKVATTGFYDVVNFARRLRAPISLAWGYNDVVCPPTSMFAAYNVIPAEKELFVELEMGHTSSPAFAEKFRERVLAMAARK